MEVVRTARNVVAKLPVAGTADSAYAEERVECRGYAHTGIRGRAIVGGRYQRTAYACEHITVTRGTLILDGR